MPFHGTPESLLARSDSKNPLHTCRGLTSNGRSCRRAISQTPGPSPSPQRSPRSGGEAADGELFCWQHKEQAIPQQSPGQGRRKARPDVIREKSSVDSLVQKLGILEVNGPRKQKERVPQKAVPVYDPDTPLPSIERDSSREYTRKKSRASKNKQDGSGGSSWCCFGEIDDGYRTARPTTTKTHTTRKSTVAVPTNRTSRSTQHSNPNHLTRPSIHRDPSSRTGEYLALIPPAASPGLTAQLLGELAKPFSEYDNEGYIYMFWLTPDSLPVDTPTRTASTLLAPPPANSPSHQRRTSEILSTYSSATPELPGSSKKTMLLKIGRAQNVHRRLNQWSRQCGYNLSLIRYYPYHASPSIASSSQSTPKLNGAELPRTPRKVPNANRIERLIHIELGDKRVKGDGKCENCGREHREWFEVEATREGVKQIDEVIRRWVDWGEKQV